MVVPTWPAFRSEVDLGTFAYLGGNAHMLLLFGFHKVQNMVSYEHVSFMIQQKSGRNPLVGPDPHFGNHWINTKKNQKGKQETLSILARCC